MPQYQCVWECWFQKEHPLKPKSKDAQVLYIKMVRYLNITYTYPPTYFKSSAISYNI